MDPKKYLYLAKISQKLIIPPPTVGESFHHLFRRSRQGSISLGFYMAKNPYETRMFSQYGTPKNGGVCLKWGTQELFCVPLSVVCFFPEVLANSQPSLLFSRVQFQIKQKKLEGVLLYESGENTVDGRNPAPLEHVQNPVNNGRFSHFKWFSPRISNEPFLMSPKTVRTEVSTRKKKQKPEVSAVGLMTFEIFASRAWTCHT